MWGNDVLFKRERLKIMRCRRWTCQVVTIDLLFQITDIMQIIITRVNKQIISLAKCKFASKFFANELRLLLIEFTSKHLMKFTSKQLFIFRTKNGAYLHLLVKLQKLITEITLNLALVRFGDSMKFFVSFSRTIIFILNSMLIKV